jgi:hypothetical protein
VVVIQWTIIKHYVIYVILEKAIKVTES